MLEWEKIFHEEFACAREVFQEVDESLGFNLSKLMFEGDQVPYLSKLVLTFQATLTQTSNAQPAIVTTSIAAIRVMQKEFGFDIKSEAHFALGHSLGEYSALVATESLSLKDAVNIVRCRGASMQDCVKDLPRKTVMSAIVLKRDSLRDLEDAMESIQTLLPPGDVAELANINSSHQAVLSGTAEGVNFASRILKDHKIALKAIDLPVSAPFHCSLMKGARGPVEEAFEGVQIQKPIVPVVFNATCRPLMSGSNCPSELIKSHLLHQIDNTVPWYYSIQFCKQSGVNRFITLGPNKVVGNLIRKDYPTDWIRFATTAEECRAEFTKRPEFKVQEPSPITAGISIAKVLQAASL
ncbi:[acyl-carrier-protein] S-malonyltransferase [Entomophthora muscae]|uniref:[acyl-carrier-protein] S-malonyltransferase n=1 Tax=Entomophthora muscae TaxID=34485 RepID=A0ACC2US79_9FUNG|nr:[acyl-carrier-protein] S-malonyltransferase [Entomophthora muscae]